MATAIPQGGVRTLLLTDIVDSTALADGLGDAAASELWRAHDRVARDLIRTWRGREIDKSDGLLVLFDTADDALGFAQAYHHALAALPTPMKARAGVHVGPVLLHENSAADVALGAKPIEVDGLAKPIAARVASLALGGQTLVTADARAALARPEIAGLRSQGHWRLKGVAEPLELFAPGGGDAPSSPPADSEKGYRVVRQREGDLWLPVRQIEHRIPAEPNAFVGRSEPLLELARRIGEGVRLVSVLGIGGSGKTRLATRFAWTSLGDFPGGVWFCDLSQARDASGIVRAVAEALDVPLPGSDEDAIARLGHAIAAHGSCLLVLDNFEQVAAHAQATLGAWLARANEARFVVTTRELLGLAGEHALHVPPLLEDDAIALFLQRARAARPGFRAAPQDQAAIARLVALLDGLPLAIELAAARVRVMPPRAILARIDERFRLLVSSSARHDRQATLRAAFDWSWELLAPADKAALAQLSVFEGGFALESAEAVLDLTDFDDGAPWPADALQSLADKSWLRARADDRFELLVSVKEYAAEHLCSAERFPGSGPAALAAAQARHCEHFAAFGEERAMAHGCAELDNLVIACRRAAMQGRAECVPGALEGAWAALKLRGPIGTSVELASLALAAPGLDAMARARVQRVAGDALRVAGKVADARTLLEAAFVVAREGPDRAFEARALLDLGQLDESEGRLDDARSRYAAACDLAIALGEPALERQAHNGLGTICVAHGQGDGAREHFEAALAIARLGGDRRHEGRILANLGVLHLEQGRLDEGRAAYEQGLAIARETGDRQFEANTLCNLGLLHQIERRLPEARETLEAALALARQMGNPRLESIVLCNLGMVFDRLGPLGEAQARFEAALKIARELKDQRSEGQFLAYLAPVHARQGRFDRARECLDAGERLLKAASDPFSLGILQSSRAETEQLAGKRAEAVAALREAEAIAAAIGTGPRSELSEAIARVRSLVRPAR
jgi:predicted ATPase/class 3 adenylate cyclase/Tfp pilus assembly protein PilF